MSEARRGYEILRGYIGREWERLRGVPDPFESSERSAQRELTDSLDNPAIGRAREYAPDTPASQVLGISDREIACRILGVSETATFVEVRTAFERLNQRSDPGNFPAGSQESIQAADIRSRVNKAYRVLSDRFDATEKRFRSLEIE